MARLKSIWTLIKGIGVSWKTSAASAIVYQAALEGVNITTISATFAQLSLMGKIKAVTLAIKEQVAAFLATPIGWIAVVTAAVLALGAVVTALSDSWQEQVKTAQSALKVNEENIQQYQNELDSLEQLQKKLKEAQGDKKALAAIQGELNDVIGETVGLVNGEAEAYKIAAVNLQTQINGKKKLIALEQQEAVNNNKTIFDNQGIEKSFLGIDWLATDISGETLRNAAKIYQERKNSGIDEKEALTSVLYQFKIPREDWDKYWQEQVSTAYSVFQKTIDNYDGFGGSTFIQKIIEGGVQGGKSLDEIQKMLNEISSNDIQPLVNEYIASLDNPDVDSESIYNNIIKKLDEIKKKYPELATLIDGYSKDLVNDIDNVSSSLEGAISNIQTFSDVFKSIKEGTDVLADAYSDIEDGGEISLEHLMALLTKYPDLVDYINLENGQHNITKDILKAKFELEKKNILLEIEGNKRIVASEIEKQRAKLNDITIEKEKAKQKMATTMVAIGQFKTLGDALNAINARPGYYLRGFDWDVNNAKVAIADSEQRLKNLSAQEALIKNMSWEDITSGSGSKTEKTEAEKYFDELKYKLETNQITQEQYLKDLDWGYKQFYNKTADYLEDYAKYSQEVYDGFKDMYKEDLEAQKEAWEKKKDAVSKYYDNLREQIKNAHDEEDYEKEQSEKRKEIFDLDMQIAELMRDGSEKAKARIAELEEERLKAEEELRDFETDKARENELSRLEKEQKAEEDKIQAEIDKIDDDLKSIDENITKARQDIINYARAKGVTLDFAYASGTRSSVGGFGRINEKGIEMISAPDGNGNYVNLMPGSYVFSAKATEFLWKLATEHSLPQAMYNSIAKSIKTQSNTPSVNIAQPITITMGDVIIKGNADKQTVFEIKKQRESDLRWILEKIKELQK